MAPLRLAALAALVVARPAAGETVADWRPFIAEASQRFDLPVAWIERVMQAESAGRTTLNRRPIVSRAGAIGLMQLMPGTWVEMRTAYRLGGDPFDPHDNIIAGTAYLRLMYDRFGYPGMFAAYNAGPQRYNAYLAGRRGLPGETRAYLAMVVAGGDVVRSLTGSVQPSAGLFVPLSRIGAVPAAPREPVVPPPGLFATLQPQ